MSRLETYGYGPAAMEPEKSEAFQACVILAGGDQWVADELWNGIAAEHGGYVPYAAAIALMKACGTVMAVESLRERAA